MCASTYLHAHCTSDTIDFGRYRKWDKDVSNSNNNKTFTCVKIVLLQMYKVLYTNFLKYSEYKSISCDNSRRWIVGFSLKMGSSGKSNLGLRFRVQVNVLKPVAKKKCNLTLPMSPTCQCNNTIPICWHEFFLDWHVLIFQIPSYNTFWDMNF